MRITRVLPVFSVCAFLIFQAASVATSADVSRVLDPGSKPEDPRLRRQRMLGDHYHPWTPAATKAEWDKQAQAIRERVLVSNGLWPMLPKLPLSPVIHGKIDRGDYTVEKVFFASLPGHYVSGNLYRPAKLQGKAPGVLCPHGHWKNGRFYDAGDTEAASQIKQGAESTQAGAHYPLQARMAQLATLGCVVFHYDMVGVADSKPIGHAAGFTDPEADLRLQSALGLQTFNSIRALDFLLSLPDVDPERIGVTGASGGGTQTFILCAIDPRPTVAFPAVMVSTNMQGGCPCETADLLRIGINNVAIAATFAPKPLGMSGANDWTVDIETKGLPELKQIYALYGSADNVHAKCLPQFGHNYNQRSRELMYDWFNAHLKLGHAAPIHEQDFKPIPPKELSVYDEAHPRPGDAKSATQLRQYLSEVADKQFAELIPQDAEGLKHYREVIGTAARVMLDPGVLQADAVESTKQTREEIEPGLTVQKGVITRKDDGSLVPYVALEPQNFNGTGIVWLDGAGKSHLFGKDGKPNPYVRKLLDAGNAVASIDMLLTGEFLEAGKPAPSPKLNAKYAGFTFAYNRPLVSNRVRDTLASMAVVLGEENVRTVKLVGTGDAGPVVLLAAGFLRDIVHEVVADAKGLSYRKIPQATDPLFLPGALKYGGLAGITALAAPVKLTVAGCEGISVDELKPLRAAYQAANGKLSTRAEPLTSEAVVELLLKK